MPSGIGIIRDGLIFLDLHIQGAGLQDTGQFERDGMDLGSIRTHAVSCEKMVVLHPPR